MELQVYQIDAWREPNKTWRYNNSFPLNKVTVNGEPTPRKILKALREDKLLPPDNKFKVDDYFTSDGVWVVHLKSNDMPLFDLVELR